MKYAVSRDFEFIKTEWKKVKKGSEEINSVAMERMLRVRYCEQSA